MSRDTQPVRPDPVGDRHIFHSALRRSYPVISHGEGCYLYDTEGRRYLDACGGAMVVSLGHGVPEIAQAVQEQMNRVAFTHRGQFSNAPLQRLAALVAEMAPPGLDLLISAFIAEPLVAAAGGVPVPPREYFATIREICDRHDVLSYPTSSSPPRG